MIEDGLKILFNLEHRGAAGADPLAGDGAGMLTQIPHEFLAEEAARLGFTLPAPGQYGVGQLFLPQDPEWRARCEAIIEEVIRAEGLERIGWRDVPTDNSTLPASVVESEPVHRQIFIARQCGRG